MLQDNNIVFFEELVHFDWYEEPKLVHHVLEILIAGGEQETSMQNFRWLIHNNALHKHILYLLENGLQFFIFYKSIFNRTIPRNTWIVFLQSNYFPV